MRDLFRETRKGHAVSVAESFAVHLPFQGAVFHRDRKTNRSRPEQGANRLGPDLLIAAAMQPDAMLSRQKREGRFPEISGKKTGQRSRQAGLASPAQDVTEGDLGLVAHPHREIIRRRLASLVTFTPGIVIKSPGGGHPVLLFGPESHIDIRRGRIVAAARYHAVDRNPRFKGIGREKTNLSLEFEKALLLDPVDSRSSPADGVKILELIHRGEIVGQGREAILAFLDGLGIEDGLYRGARQSRDAGTQEQLMQRRTHLCVIGPAFPGSDQNSCIGGDEIPQISRHRLLGGGELALELLQREQARLPPGISVLDKQALVFLPVGIGLGGLFPQEQFAPPASPIPQQQQHTKTLHNIRLLQTLASRLPQQRDNAVRIKSENTMSRRNRLGPGRLNPHSRPLDPEHLVLLLLGILSRRQDLHKGLGLYGLGKDRLEFLPDLPARIDLLA